MKYHCQECNYETNDRRLWYGHKKTKKHIENSIKDTKIDRMTLIGPSTDPHKTLINPSNKNKEFKCEFCDLLLSKSCHLVRHYKTCIKKKYAEEINKLKDENLEIKKENKIKSLEEKIKSIENEKNLIKKQSEEKIKSVENEKKLLIEQKILLEKENEYHKQLVISAGNMIQSSMSTLNHLISNYNNAPVLEPLKDYSILEDKNKFINNLTYYHNENKLNQYIGNFLVKHYKTKDPNKRSNWNSDTSRLTYINRELVNNKPNWVIDKRGIKMSNIIIEPFLMYIKKISQMEINSLKDELEEIQNNNLRSNIINKMTSLSEIIKNINNNTLSKDINRYLAPHFYFDKNNILVLKENSDIKIED